MAQERGSVATMPEQQDMLFRLSDLLARSNIRPEDVMSIDSVRVSDYQVATKNEDGVPEITQLHATQAVLRPRAAQCRKDLSEFVSQANPVIVPPVEVHARVDDEVERLLIVPDLQGGFRKFEDGVLEPTHSEEAVDVMLQIVRDLQPDRIVMNGDNLDFPTLSKHKQEHYFKNTLQPAVNYVHQLLALMRAAAPNAKIVYLAGNHEQRLEDFIERRAPELYELVQAGSDERVMTVPFLLNLKALGVEYISGYSAAEYYISDAVKIIHGTKAKSNTSTVAGLARTESETVVQGHSHREEVAMYTRKRRRLGKTVGELIVAASFGTLASIKGRVPSYGSAVNDRGKPVDHVENWQNGLGYMEVYRATGRLALMQPIFMDTFDPRRPYATRFNGKTYTPNRRFIAAQTYLRPLARKRKSA